MDPDTQMHSGSFSCQRYNGLFSRRGRRGVPSSPDYTLLNYTQSGNNIFLYQAELIGVGHARRTGEVVL
jgi:hypothetical protein